MFNPFKDVSSLISQSAPQMGGLPRYSYDPQSQQYTQIASQKPTQPTGGGPIFDVIRHLGVQQSPQDMVHRYSYDPATQQYTHLKIGGLARAEAAGRHGDDRLVHMSSGELEALRALARHNGRDLTINPQTGLPEAFKLKDLLPIAATGAMMFFGGPAGLALGESLGLEGALAQGVGMGLLSGGVTTALTGDVNKGLKAGLMGGLASGAMASFAGPSTPEVPTSNVQTAVPAAQAAQAPVQVTEIPPTAPMTASPQGFENLGYEGLPPGTQSYAPPPPAPPPSVVQSASGTNYPIGPEGQTGADWEQMPENSAMQQVQNPPKGLVDQATDWWKGLKPWQKVATVGGGIMATSVLAPKPKLRAPPIDKGTIRPYTYTRTQMPGAYPTGPIYGQRGLPVLDTRERSYFNDYYTAGTPYAAAEGGEINSYAVGGGINNQPTGPVEQMSQNVIGAGGMYPQSQMEHTNFATPTQMPASAEVVASDYDAQTNPFTGDQTTNMAGGGLPPLGSYSDGGRLLKGPGDGVSDDIPATISGKQPARLANNEFVIPARIVSEIGNGSTDAGAQKLYAMMDRVQKHRAKTVGKKKFAVDSKAYKELDKL